MDSNTVDHIYRVLSIAIWSAVLWRGLLTHALSELWWACALLAAIATLQIDTTAAVVDRALGRLYLSVLVTHLAAVIAATLVTRWQVGVSVPPHRARPRRLLLLVAMGSAILAITGTWFLAPARTPPETGSPFGHPAMSVHLLLFYVFLIAVAVVFIYTATGEAAVLPRGDLLFALRALIASATCLLIWALGGAALLVGDLAGTAHPRPVATTTQGLLLLFFALFLIGVCWPLIRREQQRHEPENIARDVTSLWRWLRDDADGGAVTDAPTDMLTLLVEIRDRMWLLQRHIRRQQVLEAARLARNLGLTGADTRAFTAAVCLELGMAAMREQQVATHPADLSTLGGGRSPRQEAYWLAAVWRATGPRSTSAAGRILRQPSPSVLES